MPPQPKTVFDPMASQTRYKLSIPDEPITALPSKTITTKMKPVETLSTVDAPSETVPALLGVSEDITGSATKMSADTEDDNKDDSARKKPASMFTSRDDNKNAPDDNDPADDTDKKNNENKNASGPYKDDDNDAAAAAADDDDVDPISNKQASLECSFLFESSTSNPGLADELNGSYDLLFRSYKLFHQPGVFFAQSYSNPSPHSFHYS